MPLEIVEKYRMLYRNYYMNQTLDFLTLKESTCYVIYPYDNDNDKFKGYNIIVEVGSTKHEDILASNNVLRNSEGKYNGVILTSPEVFNLNRIEQKAIMAHEWIEVMYCFEHERRLSESKRISDKPNFEKLIVLLLLLDQDAKSPWQDSDDDWLSLYKALRHLLVSRHSIIEMLDENFNIQRDEFNDLVENDVDQTISLLYKLIETFSDKWSVDPSLVLGRIREILLQKT